MNRYIILIGSLKKGGAERNAAILANYLVAQGHDVSIAMFKTEIAFNLNPQINIVRINHKRFNSSFINIIYIIFKLKKLIYEKKPRRLIAMSRIASLLCSATMFRRTIVRFDCYPLSYKKYKQMQFWFFYNLPWVKYVICPSKELKDDVKQFFIKKNKLKIIYNPVPLTKNSDEKSNEYKRQYFIIVSRLQKQKNIDKIIEAYHKKDIFKTADLMILGDGPENEALRDLVRDKGLSSSVIFKGFINNPYPYIKNAIALVSASIREGFPNVLIEALSLGTPVISSEAKTGPKEIIFDSINGFLFSINDFDKLGELMHLLSKDKSTLEHLCKNSNLGLERFLQNKIMDEWEKVL